ncbi:MAG: RsmD family RNA methyltransferase [Synergistaceae bacterium]|nr:RsmD family RNA methyltransferase [Synergistaceae bacterium]
MKDVRPTSGRVVSALFSILGGKVGGARFLDLFAGTGRVGLEALRRGAESCVFVESVKSRAEEIRKSAGESLVLSLEVRRAVSWLVKRNMTFDVIFADPPYCSGWCETLPSLPNLAGLFAPDAVMVIEHSSREPLALSDNPNSLMIDSVRDYGETCLTFLKQAQE